MTDNHHANFLRKIRSFVRRDGRMTDAQRQAIERGWPNYGLSLQQGMLDFNEVFHRHAPRVLEIGFGSGHSLLAMAMSYPEHDFIGIETHQPGIGTLMQSILEAQLTNIRIYYADAVEVLHQCIPQGSLDILQIFFPDPWRKRRHHKRRLIQPEFVELISQKLKLGGELHLATDWEDYAKHMMRVLSQSKTLRNAAGASNYAQRSSQRPVITKFEQRGENSGHAIRELLFQKI